MVGGGEPTLSKQPIPLRYKVRDPGPGGWQTHEGGRLARQAHRHKQEQKPINSVMETHSKQHSINKRKPGNLTACINPSRAPHPTSPAGDRRIVRPQQAPYQPTRMHRNLHRSTPRNERVTSERAAMWQPHSNPDHGILNTPTAPPNQNPSLPLIPNPHATLPLPPFPACALMRMQNKGCEAAQGSARVEAAEQADALARASAARIHADAAAPRRSEAAPSSNNERKSKHETGHDEQH